MTSAFIPLETAHATPRAAHRLDSVRLVVGAFLVSRLVLAGMVALTRLAVVPGPAWRKGGLLGALSGLDPSAHLALARNGGWFDLSVHHASTAFFPLYPTCVKLMSYLTLGNIDLAGVLVANLALLAAGFMLYNLLTFDGQSARVRTAAVTFLMFSPASYFFSCATADSMALMLALGCMLAARKGNWFAAAILGLLLCATMNVGFWIAVPLAFEYALQTRNARAAGGARFRPAVLLLALIPLHAAALLMLSRSQGRWLLAPLRIAVDWKQAHQRLVELSTMFLGYRTFYEWLFWAVIIGAVVLCVVGWRMGMRPSYVAFAAVLIIGCLWAHDLEAARTLGVAFPLFVALGLIAENYERAADLALTCSMTLLLLLTLVTANGFWLT